MSIRCFVFFSVAIALSLSAQSTSASFTPSNIAGAPYTGTVITERTEIRADGTRFVSPVEEQTMYRDSAGRTRINMYSENCRIGACLFVIADPLAGFRYQIYSDRKIVERFPIQVSRPPV